MRGASTARLADIGCVWVCACVGDDGRRTTDHATSPDPVLGRLWSVVCGRSSMVYHHPRTLTSAQATAGVRLRALGQREGSAARPPSRIMVMNFSLAAER